MYLKDQIQMLIDRGHELEEEVDNNEKAIRRLEFINEQIQKTKDELENCIEELQFIEEQVQDNLTMFYDQE